MITVKNKAAIGKMTTAGALLSEVLAELKSVVAVGMTSAELNDFIELELKRRNLLSKTKGYMGYRHASCISVNDEVVHGVPSARRVFQNGDLVKVDVCASWSGYCADMARCFIIGQTDRTLQLQKMSLVAEQALFAGAKHAKAGGRLSDISAAIQAVVEAAGYGVVRDFAGHGIGKAMRN
jgi:methionyl aminopeptidase